MNKFVLSVDSTCDLSQSFVKDNDIWFAPLKFTMDSGTIEDCIDSFDSVEQYKTFYNRLREGVVPRTALLNTHANYEHFKEIIDSGAKNILHFSLSRGLSPTVEKAREATEQLKAEYPDVNFLIIDSLSATVGMAIEVFIALEMRNAGKTMQEVYDYIMPKRLQIQHFISVDDLFYLKRGGRISVVGAVVGTALNLKPFISFDDAGKLNVIEKCKGQRKVYSSMVEKLSAMPPAEEHYMTIVHTDAEDKANELLRIIQEKFGITPRVQYMGPTIGSHVGPGSVSLAYLSQTGRNEYSK